MDPLAAAAVAYGVDQYLDRESAGVAYNRQKEMYQNRYRWTMDDLRRSGLNPIMAAQGGTIGAGGFPTVQKAGGTAKSLASSAHDIFSAEKAEAETGKVVQEVENLQKNIELIGTEINMNEESVRKIQHEVGKIHAEMQKTNADTDKINASVKIIKSRIQAAQTEENIDKSLLGKALAWFKRLVTTIAPVIPLAPGDRGGSDLYNPMQ